MKKIALIGSTGSIGKQVIKVVKAYPDKFSITAMCARSDYEEFCKQINCIKPAYAALADENSAKRIGDIPQGTCFLGGEEAALRAVTETDADAVFVAASGFDGLKYSLAAINAERDVALANKETLVCGGDLVTSLAKKKGVNILPVDSEHSAIWQCLNFNADKSFKNLIITASGGAFRDFTEEQLKSVTPEQALNHPTWKMGKKITVDCATLLNKGYEVIEAHHLYSADYSAIKTVIHRESVVHSMVEFSDGAVLAQMGVPSMIVPIQLALSFPERYRTEEKSLNFSQAFSLNFQPLVRKKFPCFDLALKSGEAGGIMPCVLNAVSEVAVSAFLNGEISFLAIAEVIDAVLQKTENTKTENFEILKAADLSARALAQKFISR